MVRDATHRLHNNVHLVSLYGLVFNTFNFIPNKGTAALTCMFGDVCSYVHAVTFCCWYYIKMGIPTYYNDTNEKFY